MERSLGEPVLCEDSQTVLTAGVELAVNAFEKDAVEKLLDTTWTQVTCKWAVIRRYLEKRADVTNARQPL